MRHRVLVAAGVFSLLGLLVGCGGGGDGGAPELPAETTGASFTIPAGETRIVHSSASINVTGDVTIAGTLQLDPGAKLLIQGENVAIPGTIVAAPTRHVSRDEKPLTGGLYIIIRKESRVNGTIAPPPATDAVFMCSTTIEQPSVLFEGTIRTQGQDGAARGENGKPSGSVLIGTEAAAAKVKEQFPELKAANLSGTFTQVTVRGTIAIGRGGRGFDDKVGVSENRTLTLLGSSGAASGALVMEADAIDVSTGTLTMAAGGDGGSVITPTGIAGFDGSSVGQAGFAVIGTSGDAGDAGEVNLITSHLTGNAPARGFGGAAGKVLLFSGHGGPAGKGGKLEAYVGRQGFPNLANGVGLATVAIAPGNGGNAPDNQHKGGDGGDAVVLDRDQASMAQVSASKIHPMEEDDVANGGDGFDGCSATPQITGSDGGNGGTLTVAGAKYDFDTSFDGGDGGDGPVFAVGGLAGIDDANHKVGVNGRDGQTCGGSGVSWDGPTLYPITVGAVADVSYRSSALNLDFQIRTDPKIDLGGSGMMGYPFINIVNGKKSTVNFSDNALDGSTLILGSGTFNASEQLTSTTVYTPAITIPKGMTINMPVTQTITQTVYNGSATPPTGQFKAQVTLMGFETITTPLGTLNGCAKVAIQYQTAAGVPTETQTIWFAPGKGQVQWTYASGASQVWNHITAP
ncbi:MAG: hypothetical protein QM758_07550 [Armatimonas sp.]